jgi:hypothetical protein
MRKAPGERYATPMQVAQALEPYEDDHASVGARERATPLHHPLGPESGTQSDDEVPRLENEPASASTRMAAAPVGLKSPPDVAANLDPSASVEPTAPLLSPLSEAEQIDEEVLLVLDRDPESPVGPAQSGPGPRSSTLLSAITASASACVEWIRPFWLWLLVIVAVMATVLIVIVATANALDHSSTEPAPWIEKPPTQNYQDTAIRRPDCA